MSKNLKAEMDINDTIMRLKLDEIGVNARGGKREKNRAFKSPVTQEEIDEYRARLDNPVIVDGKQYKYAPADIDVELEDKPNLLKVLNDEEIAQTREAINGWIKQAEKLTNVNLNKLLDEKKNINR